MGLAGYHVFGCLGLVLCVITSLLHSLEGLGLGRDHNRSGPHAGQVPRTQFRGRAGLGFGRRHGGGCRTAFRSLGNCPIVARWRLRKGGLAVFLEGRYGRNTGSLASGPHVVHHGLGRGGARARAARAGRGEGVGLYEFGFGSLRILPEMSCMISKSVLNGSTFCSRVKLKLALTNHYITLRQHCTHKVKFSLSKLDLKSSKHIQTLMVCFYYLAGDNKRVFSFNPFSCSATGYIIDREQSPPASIIQPDTYKLYLTNCAK